MMNESVDINVILRINCLVRGRRLRALDINAIQELFKKVGITSQSVPVETSRGTFLACVTKDAANLLISNLHGQEIAELRGLRLFLTVLNDDGTSSNDEKVLLTRAIERETRANAHKGHPPHPMDANVNVLPGIPGLLVVHNFITEEEESDLIVALDNRPWISQLSRRVQHYGATFDYVKRRPVEEGDVKDESVPTPFSIASCPSLSLVAKKISNRGFLGELGDDRIRKDRHVVPLHGLAELDAFYPQESNISDKYPLCDQITINEYTSGLGISSHVDTHIGFEDGIISLSMGAEYVMEFSYIRDEKEYTNEKDVDIEGRKEEKDEDLIPTSTVLNVVLPRRSLLVLRGEARYAWAHSIPARKTDSINGVVTPRGRRVSATFRIIRRENRPCTCSWSHVCIDQRPSELFSPRLLQDDKAISKNMKRNGNKSSAKEGQGGKGGGGGIKAPKEPKGLAIDPESIALPVAGQLSTPSIESRHVHVLYDVIASHFSDTRHSRWPRVETYLSFLPKGSILLDIGCGNGKYLGARPLGDIWAVGIDRSSGLVDICSKRSHEAAVGDALCVPFRRGIGDVVFCIAVLHHISTRPRRVLLIRELLRSARPDGGHILIYAWAQEQGRDSKRAFASQDVLVPWCLSTKYTGASSSSSSGEIEKEDDGTNQKAPISDAQMIEAGGVPDPERNVVVFQRYCHVYIAGELQGLTKEACEAEGLAFYGEKDKQEQNDTEINIKAQGSHLTVSTRPTDEDSSGPIASPESIPDSVFGPMRVNVNAVSTFSEQREGIDEALLEGLDPITRRVAQHAASSGKSILRHDRITNQSSDSSTEPFGGVRLLDAWWERDNWCILLRREG
jgi:ubiquinone/menaquinone biosynthesis C-methylase UbiE